MLTLEVNGQFITWPAEFAFVMMKNYRKHGIPFVVYGDCAHAGKMMEVSASQQVGPGTEIPAGRPCFGN
jgi:hypothetical protein